MTNHATFLLTLQASVEFREFENWYLDNENYDILAPYYTGILPFKRLPESFQLTALVDYFRERRKMIIKSLPIDCLDYWYWEILFEPIMGGLYEVKDEGVEAPEYRTYSDALRAAILKAITLI